MKYLSKKIVLKLLNLEKIDRSIVISDPFQKDCPMVYISKEFSKHTGYSIKESLGKNWSPLEIRFEHLETDGYKEHETRINCPVEFGRRTKAIAFRKRDHESKKPNCDPYLF